MVASAYNVEDPGSIPGSERSPGEGNGNLLQYSCLRNPKNRGAYSPWGGPQSKSQTLLNNLRKKNRTKWGMSQLSFQGASVF